MATLTTPPEWTASRELSGQPTSRAHPPRVLEQEASRLPGPPTFRATDHEQRGAGGCRLRDRRGGEAFIPARWLAASHRRSGPDHDLRARHAWAEGPQGQ